MTKRLLNITLALGMLIFVVLLGLGPLVGQTGFVLDILLFMALILIFYFNFDRLRLTVPIFALLILGFIPHSLGIYGWYAQSPLPFAWDHLTHFFGMIPLTMLIFQYLSPLFDRKFIKWTNFGILVLIFLAVTGIGAVVEMTEFVGFLNLGFGDGALRFGDGDSIAGIVTAAADKDFTQMIDVVGGGWINEGWDFIYNTFGVISGLIIMCLVRWLRPSSAEK